MSDREERPEILLRFQLSSDTVATIWIEGPVTDNALDMMQKFIESMKEAIKQ